ncbi:MAG: Gfo/Idh/MocA family oxidoreductase [Clostridiales bacterium]|nr:Gfo/Idh/MocA family oxidoreductase [Clostridiales bacterium]
MKINVGFVGYGHFAPHIIPYFLAHPDVNKVALAELIPERRAEGARRFGITELYDSFDDMLQNGKDINCIAVHVQRHYHGDMVIRSLQAGKHVYSAVPMASSVEEVARIAELAGETGLIYAMGENRCYDPTTILCRELYTSGALGTYLYGQAHYSHDFSHFHSYERYTGRDNWAGFPPMYYCTHSVSMILSSLGEHVTRVSCMGYHDPGWAHIFSPGKNHWDNPYINETATMRLSGGGIMRINEFRRRAWGHPPTTIECMNGTLASYERSMDRHTIQYALPEGGQQVEDVSARVIPAANIGNMDGSSAYAPIQPVERLPESFRTLHISGHEATHPFVIDDFVRAVKTGKLPPINAWAAARYMLPGLIAHESALRDGEPLPVPDLGEPPAGWEVMGYST